LVHNVNSRVSDYLNFVNRV